MKTNSFGYVKGWKEIDKDKKRIAVNIEKRLKKRKVKNNGNKNNINKRKD